MEREVVGDRLVRRVPESAARLVDRVDEGRGDVPRETSVGLAKVRRRELLFAARVRLNQRVDDRDRRRIARSGAAEVRHEASQRRRAEARRRADAALAVESEVVREEPEQDEVHVGRERSQARPRRILDPRVDLAVSTLARGLAVAVEDRICAPEEVPVRGVSIAIELKSMRFMLLTCSL